MIGVWCGRILWWCGHLLLNSVWISRYSHGNYMLVIIDTRPPLTTCCPAGSLDQWRLPWYLKGTTCTSSLQSRVTVTTWVVLSSSSIVLPPLKIHYSLGSSVWICLGGCLYNMTDVTEWNNDECWEEPSPEVSLRSEWCQLPARTHEPPPCRVEHSHWSRAL